MVEANVHRVDRKLESALRRLQENERIPQEGREVLQRFVEEQAANGLSEYRQLFYLTHLAPFAEELGEDFLDPTEAQVRELVARVNRSKLSEWSKTNKRTALKRFYKWLLGEDEEYPPCVKWVKTKGGNHTRKLPEDLLTREEIVALQEAARNPRDRALVALLADGGLRIGEALNLRVKDVHPDEHGAFLMVPTGKTGARRVRLLESVPHLMAWRRAHPFREEPEAPLFCYLSKQEPGEGEKRRIRGHRRGESLTYAAARKALRDLAERGGVDPAKVKKTHTFRHTRATILAKTVPEAPLEAQMGWVPGSQMSRVYVHLSGRDVDEAILRSHGVELDQGKTRESPLQKCPRCGELNEAEGRYCANCGMALSKDAARAVEATEAKIRDELKRLVEEEVQRALREREG